MKINAVLFWVIFLILPTRSISQINHIYYSLEEANSVHKDSVFILDLSKQKLVYCPDEILTFTNLTELDLSKNKLSKLPNGLKSLVHLEKLNISKNKFELFPIPLCSTISLTDLQLGKNNINSLPSCISQLKNLEHLDIWYNNIYALPTTISQLKKLKTLDFRGVNLSETTQAQIQALIPSTKIEFDIGCDCAH
jgi:Leucine-rich repeat (LRR) protein